MEEFPPGFRFYPTEEELVSFYLRYKLQGISLAHLNRVIPVIDIYELEPWHLPKFSGELCNRDTEQWFFFVPRQEREARGGRPNRTTASGYWKATGSPNYVYSTSNKVIGVKKTMVFYKGKAPSGRKTKWKMNEYRAIEEEVPASSSSSTINCAAPRSQAPPLLRYCLCWLLPRCRLCCRGISRSKELDFRRLPGQLPRYAKPWIRPWLRYEMSVCRVYVVSGSCRAFDRRPLGTVIRETVDDHEAHGNEVAKCDENAPKIEKTSSPESSYSGEKDLTVDFIENEGTSNSEMINGLEWELEQFDWQ